MFTVPRIHGAVHRPVGSIFIMREDYDGLPPFSAENHPPDTAGGYLITGVYSMYVIFLAVMPLLLLYGVSRPMC